MDDAYRLVFRGEVLDGQHAAVVKKRLVDALRLSEDQAAKLFSGSTVILKRQADTKTAARYQGLFKKAGARLRVMPVEDAQAAQGPVPESTAAAATAPSKAAQPKPAEPAPGATDMQVLPVGTDVLRNDERRETPVVTVDVSHLDILDDEAALVVEASAPEIVSVPEFSLADLGVDLVEHLEAETIDIDPQFELAEVGADIPTIPVDQTPVVDIASIRFDVAEVGSDIGMPHDAPDAAVPDISHLSLVAE